MAYNKTDQERLEYGTDHFNVFKDSDLNLYEKVLGDEHYGNKKDRL